MALSLALACLLVVGVGCTDGQSAGLQLISTGDTSKPWPDSTAGNYLVGQFAMEHGDLVTARESLDRALTADPDNQELRHQVFAVGLAQGSYDEKAASSLLALDPNAEEARLVLALGNVKRGQFAAAATIFEAIGNRGVAAIAAPVMRAWALYGAGQKDAARALLRETKPDDGFEGLRAYHLAMMDALDGKVDAARDQLKALLVGDRPSPLRIAMSLTGLDVRRGDKGGALQALQGQMQFYEENSAIEEAMARVREGQEPPVAIRDATSGIADTLMSLAAALQDQQAVGQALIYARFSAYLDPKAGDTLALIGRALLARNDGDGAIAAFDRVPKESPFAWDVELLKVATLDQIGQSDKAEAMLRQMAQDRPERLDALITLGDMLRQKEKFTEAEQAYTQAVQRLHDPNAQDWRLFYARGITYERTDRWPQAEADFKKALKLQPDQPYVLNYLGYSWVDKGIHLEEGRQMLRKAVELRPDDGFVVDSLGWAYFRLGDIPRSVAYLERAVELQPGDATINDHLGDAYWRAGREREARFQWHRSLSLNPTAEQTADIEKKLNDGLPRLPDNKSSRG
ncbi:Tfp pilus assembly protein PilF [Arboricoccus pini]|uniref:Tfp pilus assembly protein PilF n=1 Tax=Arboricoccus pini TaxID=1963835 RepID=A0A212PYC4_9PROT|nr:Tfp pilus assembly protein PilF [Arboricoccus pini]